MDAFAQIVIAGRRRHPGADIRVVKMVRVEQGLKERCLMVTEIVVGEIFAVDIFKCGRMDREGPALSYDPEKRYWARIDEIPNSFLVACYLATSVAHLLQIYTFEISKLRL